MPCGFPYCGGNDCANCHKPAPPKREQLGANVTSLIVQEARRWKAGTTGDEEFQAYVGGVVECVPLGLHLHLWELLTCMERFTDEMTVGERYSNAGQAALDSLPVLRDAIAALGVDVPLGGEQHE